MISTTRTLYEITPQVSYLRDTGNISLYTEPTTITIGGVSVLLLPWICDENYEHGPSELYLKVMLLSVWGILSLMGLKAHPGHVMDRGMDPTHFSKFNKVFSGHYHMKSSKGNVNYLGNPYQLYWNDYGCKRGFHIFDTESLKTTFYRNPF